MTDILEVKDDVVGYSITLRLPPNFPQDKIQALRCFAACHAVQALRDACLIAEGQIEELQKVKAIENEAMQRIQNEVF